jgi:hypothetical protein
MIICVVSSSGIITHGRGLNNLKFDNGAYIELSEGPAAKST